MIMLVDMLFAFGNFILCVGVLFLIQKVVKNRRSLDGYSLTGAILTVIPIGLFIIAYMIMGNWIAIMFASFTFVYWLSVVGVKVRWRK